MTVQSPESPKNPNIRNTDPTATARKMLDEFFGGNTGDTGTLEGPYTKDNKMNAIDSRAKTVAGNPITTPPSDNGGTALQWPDSESLAKPPEVRAGSSDSLAGTMRNAAGGVLAARSAVAAAAAAGGKKFADAA